MKNNIWLCGLVLILLPGTSVAGVASAFKAADLMDDCQSAQDDLKKLNSDQMAVLRACMSYIIGVVDGYAIGTIASGKDRTMACDIPDSVTTRQLAQIVFHYLKDHPEELHLPAATITMKALNKSFPCKAESP